MEKQNAEPEVPMTLTGAHEMAAIANLVESPFNTRKVFKNLDELAASIKSVGILSPLLVRPCPDNEGDDETLAVTHEGLPVSEPFLDHGGILALVGGRGDGGETRKHDGECCVRLLDHFGPCPCIG